MGFNQFLGTALGVAPIREVSRASGSLTEQTTDSRFAANRINRLEMRIFATQNRSGFVRAGLRAIMFMVGCAIMLAAASPWMPKLAWMWSETFLGAVTSIGAFALTVVFVRWERLELTDVGARPDRWTALRFPCGFAIGLLVVALWASISAGCGYVHWARGP